MFIDRRKFILHFHEQRNKSEILPEDPLIISGSEEDSSASSEEDKAEVSSSDGDDEDGGDGYKDSRGKRHRGDQQVEVEAGIHHFLQPSPPSLAEKDDDNYSSSNNGEDANAHFNLSDFEDLPNANLEDNAYFSSGGERSQSDASDSSSDEGWHEYK